jgi:ribosomal protein L11 methyltransferase
MGYYELTIRSSEKIQEALIHRLLELGCLGVFEQDDSFIAYFPDSLDINTITNELRLMQTILKKAEPARVLTFDHALLPEQDWNESWKKGFVPIEVGKQFTILPPWEKPTVNRINLIIDPGMAFGTGHHETTRSCLLLMEKNSDLSAKKSFLDIGTGTGVLAIAASKIGFQRIIGVDTDPLAVEAARKNIEFNKVYNVEIREGDITRVQGRFDLITANLFSTLLVQSASAISYHLNTHGIAILAGMMIGQQDEVIAEMEREGLSLAEQTSHGKWVTTAFTRIPLLPSRNLHRCLVFRPFKKSPHS